MHSSVAPMMVPLMSGAEMSRGREVGGGGEVGKGGEVSGGGVWQNLLRNWAHVHLLMSQQTSDSVYKFPTT